MRVLAKRSENMDQGTVKRVAGIAHMNLTDEELKKIEGTLCAAFNALNIIGEAPECDSLCFDPVDVCDSLRDDVPVIYENTDELLKGMGTYDGLVRGPKIV